MAIESAELEKKLAPDVPSIGSEEKGHVSDGAALRGETELLGYKPELQKNRSMLTLLFQSLAIAAIPYGEGAPLLSAIYGGGQLSIFLGWISKYIVLIPSIERKINHCNSRFDTRRMRRSLPR